MCVACSGICSWSTAGHGLRSGDQTSSSGRRSRPVSGATSLRVPDSLCSETIQNDCRHRLGTHEDGLLVSHVTR